MNMNYSELLDQKLEQIIQSLYEHPDGDHTVSYDGTDYCVWYGDRYLGCRTTLVDAVALCTSCAETMRESLCHD